MWTIALLTALGVFFTENDFWYCFGVAVACRFLAGFMVAVLRDLFS